MSAERFKSIRAFTEFESESSGAPQVDPVRVLATLKDLGGSLRKGELADRLEAGLPAVDRVVLDLVEKRLLKVERGEQAASDLVVLL